MSLGLIDKFKNSYEKVLTIVVFIILGLSLLILAVRLGTDKKKELEWQRQRDRMKVAHEKVKPLDPKIFNNLLIRLAQPPLIETSKWGNVMLTVPTHRVWCVDCKMPIPFDAMVCIKCGAKQPKPGGPEIPPTLDTDGDGITDLVEMKLGMNRYDKADAAEDFDGDGFSNEIEIKYKSDINDPKDTPPQEAWLTVKSIKIVPFKYLFKSTAKNPDGKLVFGINDIRTDRTLFKQMGEYVTFETNKLEMVKAYKIVGYKQNIVNEPIPGIPGKTRQIDKSVLTIEKGNKKINLIKDKPYKGSDYVAILYFEVDNQEIRNLSKGSEFTLRDNKYKVKNIDFNNKSVVIKRLSDSMEFTLGKSMEVKKNVTDTKK